MNHPVNPYVAGAPLREERGFFGRQKPTEWVTRELRNSATNSLVLFGQRRIGKTSLLLKLQRILPDDVFLPVYFDLLNQATRPLGLVLAYLAKEVAKRTGLEPPEPDVFEDQGDFFCDTFLPQLYQALDEHCRPVFLLDEFDVLDQVTEAELPETVAARALLPFLRKVMTEDPRPAFVFVVGRRAEDLSLDVSATFRTALVREIWVLDPTSAEALVRQAEANGTLRFTDEAVTRILSLTSGHPFLTQLLCQRIWERAYASNPTALPVIDVSEVEPAVQDALEAGDQALAWLWSGLSPAEKIYAAALAEAAGDEDIISENQVIQVLAAHADRLRRREVELAPHDLVKRRVLEQAGDREYRFAVELFCHWVRDNKPVREVKDEVDRLEPFAGRLYDTGKDYFNRCEWEKASGLFRDALEKNPRHFRARLHLGEALLELTRIDEAVTELGRAYEMDSEEARLPLARAWVTKARLQEEAGDEDGALAACEQALKVSPDEQAAQEIRTAIWMRRGDAALKRSDLKAALDAYRGAGDTEGIIEVEALQRRERLERLRKQAEGHLAKEEWPQAIRDLKVILEEDPNYWNVADRLKEAEKQKEIAVLYRTAVGLQETGGLAEAIDKFTEIIRQVGVYKDVPDRLARTQRRQELDARFTLGEDYRRQGKWREAARAFEEVYDIDPEYRGVRARLEEVRRELDLDELHRRVETSFRADNWEGAVETLEELHNLDPSDGSVVAKLQEAKGQLELEKLYRKGMMHLQRKRWRKARSTLEKVVLLAPGYRDAEAKLKVAREQSGQSNPVIEFLRDPVWQGIGVIIAILLAMFPLVRACISPPMPTPTSAPTPTSTIPMPTGTLTPTVSPTLPPTLFPPVTLEEPEDGLRLPYGPDVELRWSCPYSLHEDEGYSLTVRGPDSYPYAVPCDEGCFTLDEPPLGEYNWTVAVVRSSSGRTLSKEADWYSFKILPSPVVDSISPTCTVRGTGVTVVVSGENFTHSLALTIGVPLPTTFVNFSMITATVPTTLEVGEYPVIVKDSMGNGTSSTSFTVNEQPTPIPTVVTPSPPPSYPPPELKGISVLGQNVTFAWTWSGTLAEDEYFAVRADIGAHGRSRCWTKETQYTCPLERSGEYVWEVAVCKGDPGKHHCEELAASEEQKFCYGGCGKGDEKKPPPPQ